MVKLEPGEAPSKLTLRFEEWRSCRSYLVKDGFVNVFAVTLVEPRQQHVLLHQLFIAESFQYRGEISQRLAVNYTNKTLDAT